MKQARLCGASQQACVRMRNFALGQKRVQIYPEASVPVNAAQGRFFSRDSNRFGCLALSAHTSLFIFIDFILFLLGTRIMSAAQMVAGPIARQVYKRIMWAARDYPGGPERIRTQAKAAIRKHQHETDPSKLRELMVRALSRLTTDRTLTCAGESRLYRW